MFAMGGLNGRFSLGCQIENEEISYCNFQTLDFDPNNDKCGVRVRFLIEEAGGG